MAPLRAWEGEKPEIGGGAGGGVIVGTPPPSLRSERGEAGPSSCWRRGRGLGGGVCAPGRAAAAAAAATLPASEAGRPRPGPSPEPLFIGASWSPRAGSAWGRAQARPAAEPRTEVACPRTRPAQPW